MILFSATGAYGGGEFGFVIFSMDPGSKTQFIKNGYWFKPGADREQLKQDYGECGVKGRKSCKSCMREKGYTWLTPGTGFWYKTGTDIEQLKQDYSECRAIGNLLKGENSCMGEKGYTWASYYEE